MIYRHWSENPFIAQNNPCGVCAHYRQDSERIGICERHLMWVTPDMHATTRYDTTFPADPVGHCFEEALAAHKESKDA